MRALMLAAAVAFALPVQAQQATSSTRPLAFRPAALDPYSPSPSPSPSPLRQERYTRQGAIIGGAIGGLGGLGFGVFFSLLCSAENDDCTNVIPWTTLIGAAGGAGLGAIIGAAIPRQPSAPRAQVEEVEEDEERRPARGRIGSTSLTPGVVGMRSAQDLTTADLDEWRTGTALRFNFFAELGSWFAIGPQLGAAWVSDGGGARHAAVAVRASRPVGRFAPYLVGDLGVYQARQDAATEDGFAYNYTLEFFGGSIGAGTRWFPFSSTRTFVDVDARWHRHLQNIEPFDMTAISLGLGRIW